MLFELEGGRSLESQINWIVGGATFGSNYGVSNKEQSPQHEVVKIIDLAKQFHWFGVDTAPVYGRSEEYLGNTDLDSLAVFSKIKGSIVPNRLRKAVLASIGRLKIEKLEGLTFHDQQSFMQHHAAFVSEIDRYKGEGLISKWGVSVYAPAEMEEVLRVASPDYFQAPVNLLDRRFLDPAFCRRARDSGTSIQARSVFLQGVLANPIASLPRYFDKWRGLLLNAEQVALDSGSDLRAHALNFVRSQRDISAIVVGIHNTGQMKQLSSLIARPELSDSGNVLVASEDLALIDPRLWSL